LQHRIDALDVFYHDNLVDERSLLFGRQRSKLRKLLNEYDAAVAAIRGGGEAPLDASRNTVDNNSSAPLPSSATASAPLSILIRPDQRLTFDHLSWWFAQEGTRELPGMDHAILERVWSHMTRTNVDGKMSVSDLKCWYISFGKRALQRNPPLTAADLEKELVPSSFMYENRESVDDRVARAEKERDRREKERLERLKEIGKADAMKSNSAKVVKSHPKISFLDVHAPPLHLPSDSFDFQLRLTEEDYKSMRLRMREIQAEGKFKERIEKANDKANDK